MSAHKPLEGVKVVELASFVAAPTAGRMMAEMGADVIRVESTAGDPWRFYGANCGLPITDEENPLFDIYNLGKKDIQLNTKTPEGKEILFHLLDEADVFITNNRLKSLVRSGLDYESLNGPFPKADLWPGNRIRTDRPGVDAPGYDGVAFFSRSGMLADMAEPSGYPASAPGCIGDGATGAALFGGICAALFDRVRTGKGDFVEISLLAMQYGFAVRCLLLSSMVIIILKRDRKWGLFILFINARTENGSTWLLPSMTATGNR